MRLPFFIALLFLFSLPLLAAEPAPPAEAPPAKAKALTLPEHVMGNPDAPVTLIEYASLTCPHCAHFAKEILPKLAEKYITPGKVKLLYRDFPLDALSLHAAEVAQCMPEDRYFSFVKTLFGNQAGWLQSSDPEATLQQYAKLAGLPGERITACLADKRLEEALVQRRLQAEERFKIKATPTFVINDGQDKIEGARDLADFESVLKKYVK